MQQLTGGLAVRDDNLHVQKVTLRTAESTVAIDGMIQRPAQNPLSRLYPPRHNLSLEGGCMLSILEACVLNGSRSFIRL